MATVVVVFVVLMVVAVVVVISWLLLLFFIRYRYQGVSRHLHYKTELPLDIMFPM